MFKYKILSVFIQSAISMTLLLATFFIVVSLMRPHDIPRHAEVQTSLNSVEVVSVQSHTTGIDFVVDGEVIPFRSLTVVPEVQGRVLFKSNNCRVGRSVKKGELLLQVDAADYELTVEEWTQAVAQAKTDMDQNEVELENTRKELGIVKDQLEIREKEVKRYESATLPGVYSRSEFDTVRSSLLSTRESVQKLENQIRVLETKTKGLESTWCKAQASLSLAQLDLKRTQITSPISGVVTTDTFEVNSYVQKGTSVAEILDTSQLEIQCSLYMKQIKWIWLSGSKRDDSPANADSDEDGTLLGGYVFPSTEVTIVYDLDGEKWSWDGKLRTLDGGGLNAATRMVPCRVTVENPQVVKPLSKSTFSTGSIPPPTLFSGMYVSVVVHAKPNIMVYRIPEKALLPGNRIWTATNGVLKEHQLHVATTVPDGVLFYAQTDGPQLNDLVVVSPLAAPVNGLKVHVVNEGSGDNARSSEATSSTTSRSNDTPGTRKSVFGERIARMLEQRRSRL